MLGTITGCKTQPSFLCRRILMTGSSSKRSAQLPAKCIVLCGTCLSFLLTCLLKYKIFESFIGSKIQIQVFLVPRSTVTTEDSHSLKFVSILSKTDQDQPHETASNILQYPLTNRHSSETESMLPVFIHKPRCLNSTFLI